MLDLVINQEAIDSSGAQSVFYAAVDELARRYGPGADDRAEMLPELREPDGFFLVARVEGHLVGGVGVRAISDPTLRFGEIKRLWIRPDRRRQGLAEALMDEALVISRARGYLEIYLETGDRQPEAQAFYVKTGWHKIDEFPPGARAHGKDFLFKKVL